jgi:hypothetical protein
MASAPRQLARVALVGMCLAVCVAAQQAEDVIKPADNLVTDGMPDIPVSIAEAVGRYTEFRGAGFADWHPRERQMLISTRFADVPQIHRVAAPGAARQQLTFFPDRVGGGSFEPKTGSYFVFAKDRGGDEFMQLYRYDLATGDITMFTDGGRSQNGGAVWSNAGGRLAYGSTRRNGRDRDVYVVDPRDKATDRRVLEVEGGGWGAVGRLGSGRDRYGPAVHAVDRGDARAGALAGLTGAPAAAPRGYPRARGRAEAHRR